MKADMVSKRIRIFALAFGLALVAWATIGRVHDTLVSRRLASADAQIAAADAEIAGAGIQTAVFALG